MALCEDEFGNVVNCNNGGWNNWGRWVALVVIIVIAFLVFFLFACLSARRRRQRGLQPYRGTGWFPGQHGPATYNPNFQSNQPYYNNVESNAPPTYTPQAGGYYGQQNQGYFGGQQTGIQPGVELQQPSNAYRGGDNVYEPPEGPPHKKAGGDGIVR